MNRTLNKPLADDLVRPLFHTSVWFYAIVLAAGTVVAVRRRGVGLPAVVRHRPERQAAGRRSGRLYLTNFVFWIGISHAGTLISAILRLVNAGWRRPVTRCAEVITVFALMIGAMFPIIHLGRPWLAFWLFPYPSAREIWPNFRSPLAWDFFAINTYLTGSVLFLFLPMIPDFALVRDRSTGWRRKVYGTLAFGWRGTTKQWNRLESAMQIMAIAILPVAVSVHTIVSFDFSMANVPMWHSTIFGPYFVAGAIFSGIAALIIAMAALRKALHLEHYLLPLHFENLGKLLLLMSMLWGYFVFNERLTVWYGNEPHEMAVFWATQRGAYAPLYWTMVIVQLRAAAGDPRQPEDAHDRRHASSRRSACVVGMWLERFLIIVPSLAHKQLPYSWGTYSPTPVELFIMAATFAAMVLLYTLFAKFVPIISIWELKAGDIEHAPCEQASGSPIRIASMPRAASIARPGAAS